MRPVRRRIRLRDVLGVAARDVLEDTGGDVPDAAAEVARDRDVAVGLVRLAVRERPVRVSSDVELTDDRRIPLRRDERRPVLRPPARRRLDVGPATAGDRAALRIEVDVVWQDRVARIGSGRVRLVRALPAVAAVPLAARDRVVGHVARGALDCEIGPALVVGQPVGIRVQLVVAVAAAGRPVDRRRLAAGVVENGVERNRRTRDRLPVRVVDVAPHGDRRSGRRRRRWRAHRNDRVRALGVREVAAVVVVAGRDCGAQLVPDIRGLDRVREAGRRSLDPVGAADDRAVAQPFLVEARERLAAAGRPAAAARRDRVARVSRVRRREEWSRAQRDLPVPAARARTGATPAGERGDHDCERCCGHERRPTGSMKYATGHPGLLSRVPPRGDASWLIDSRRG